MNRTLVATLGTIGVGVLAFALLSGPRGGDPRRVTPLDEPEAEPVGRGPRAPIEATAPAAPPGSGASASASPAGAGFEPVADGPAIAGVVVDAATGEGLPGAVVEVRPSRPEGIRTEPTRRGATTSDARNSGLAAQTTTSPTGRFVVPWDEGAGADVRVRAPGHLDATRVGVTTDETLKIALRPGAAIRGRVHRRDGVGIEGATVRALTTTRDETRRETVESSARSGADGSFEVLGLPGQPARLVADHPEYMPGSAQATPGGPAADLALVAALRAWFRLRASDGGALATPVAQWTRTSTAGRPLEAGVTDLEPSGDPGALDAWGPVRVPSEPADGTVRFVVSAPGRLPWTSDEVAMPAGGAERTLDVALERDPAAGSLAIRVLDPDGRELALPRADALVTVRRTDGPSRPGRPTAREGALVYDGLPAGTYDVFATDRRFGAATVGATIEGGREARVDIRLAAPAALRVTITTGSRRRVQFQLLRDGAPVPAFDDAPSPDPARAAGALDAGRLHFLAGPDGVVLRGLASGRYAVRIVSPDLAAADTEVEVATGGTTEVSVRASPR